MRMTFVEMCRFAELRGFNLERVGDAYALVRAGKRVRLDGLVAVREYLAEQPILEGVL
jgi:hypothetical protein